MASLLKTYDKTKLFGQIYTPTFVVEKILNDINYFGQNILNKRILDPSCGDGQFLISIAKRIIDFSPPSKLIQNLLCIHGWDIDPLAILQCRRNLNDLVKDLNITVDWNISTCNALEKIQTRSNDKKTFNEYDFIIGNPPYIRVQHLKFDQRKFIQENYKFCSKGATDIYIAFFELALNCLSPIGVCCFITPNTYFYTDTAKKLRNELVKNNLLRKLTNYGTIQLFNNASTYSAISIIGRQNETSFTYEEAYSPYDFIEKEISFEDLYKDEPWRLTISKDFKGTGIKLKDVAKIHCGLTTLCDKAYFFPITKINEKYATAKTRLKGNIKIESAILKPLIKASKYKSPNQEITEYALFPYKKTESGYKIISEKDMKKSFPLAYDYLLSVKDELDKRDNGKVNPFAWYAYGRNQGINLPTSKRILFSPMNKYPNFQICHNSEAIFYSGYCLLYEGDLNLLLEQLNSDKMWDYIAVSSRDFRGGYKAYNKTIVQEFQVNI